MLGAFDLPIKRFSSSWRRTLPVVDRGNSVLVIEHHLDVIKCADWVIDLGPEGGRAGGQIMAVGTPEQIAARPENQTGKFLGPLLQAD